MVSEMMSLMMATGMSPMSGGNVLSKIDRLTPEQVDKVLTIMADSEVREASDTKHRRYVTITYALIAAGLFVFATMYLSQASPAVYEKLLERLLIFAGGMGAGSGITYVVNQRRG